MVETSVDQPAMPPQKKQRRNIFAASSTEQTIQEGSLVIVYLVQSRCFHLCDGADP
jgi:hypothetical protein